MYVAVLLQFDIFLFNSTKMIEYIALGVVVVLFVCLDRFHERMADGHLI